MASHTVSRGETLQAIAQKYGYSDWKAIYNNPKNADLRKKRPDPNFIQPGDVIYIAIREVKPITVTESTAAPIADDNFDSITYDLDYRSEHGGLSKYLVARYSDGTKRDINIDSVTNPDSRLWAAKQRVLIIMDDYNTNFILGPVFAAVWFIVTISPTATPVAELPGVRPPKYTVSMRTLAKSEAQLQTEGAALASRLQTSGKRVVVNVGGTGEVPDAINLNPNKVAPRKGIPNLIEKGGEEIGEIFNPATVDEITSNRLPPNTLDWDRILPGAQKVLKPGGRITIKFQGVGGDGPKIVEQLRNLGFKDINNPMNLGAVIEAVK